MSSPSSQTTILLAEPDAMFRKALSRALELAGFGVENATTADQIFHTLKTRAIALLVVDIHLPGMDGITLLRQLHTDHPDTPVMVLTRRATLVTAIEAVKLGVADYLLKPLPTKTILDAVRGVLETRASRAHREKLANTVMEMLSGAETTVAPVSPPPADPASVPPAEGGNLLHAPPILLDAASRQLFTEDDFSDPVPLSRRETDVLAMMMRHANEILTFDDLATVIWDDTPPCQQEIQKIIRPCISRIRKKIEKKARRRVIFTVRHTGYLYRTSPKALQ